MTMLRRLATTILSLGCAVGVVACGSPAQSQIDQGSKLLAYWIRGIVRAERGDRVDATADLRRAIGLAPSPDFADGIRSLMAEYGLE